MRLIDVDELNELMYHETFETDSEMQKWDSGCWIRYKMFENNISKCKSVEAEPVRHGHWINKCVCSICIWEHEDYDGNFLITDYSFCPNCGAKMDEVE